MASSSVAAAGAAAGTHKKALIVHPQWHHTLQHDPLALSFWEQCCDAVLTKIAADCATEPRTLAALMAVNTRCRCVHVCWTPLFVLGLGLPARSTHGSTS
jgi:hypothetical protein